MTRYERQTRWESREMHSTVPVYVVAFKADHSARHSFPHNHCALLSHSFYTLTARTIITRVIEHATHTKNIVTCTKSTKPARARAGPTAFPDWLKRSHASRRYIPTTTPRFPHRWYLIAVFGQRSASWRSFVVILDSSPMTTDHDRIPLWQRLSRVTLTPSTFDHPLCVCLQRSFRQEVANWMNGRCSYIYGQDGSYSFAKSRGRTCLIIFSNRNDNKLLSQFLFLSFFYDNIESVRIPQFEVS